MATWCWEKKLSHSQVWSLVISQMFWIYWRKPSCIPVSNSTPEVHRLALLITKLHQFHSIPYDSIQCPWNFIIFPTPIWGFPARHGGTFNWMVYLEWKIPSRNGWWLGIPPISWNPTRFTVHSEWLTRPESVAVIHALAKLERPGIFLYPFISIYIPSGWSNILIGNVL